MRFCPLWGAVMMNRLLLLVIFAVLVGVSLLYNALVFKRGRSVAHHQTTLELRALLKERVRVRKLSQRHPSRHQKNHPHHRCSAHGAAPVCP